MDYRRLGRTEMHVSALGLGTWQLGGEWGRQFTQQDVDRLFRRAQELGINLVDTAECYGDHLAESLIGRAISRNRKDWIVATKFGHRFHSERMIDERWSPGSVRSDHWSPGEVLEQLDRSLQALRTDYIDLYLFHSGGDEVFDNDELWAALNDQVRKGSIRFLGVALGASDNLHQTARATTVGASVIELTYNRLNRAAEAAVFESCHEQNLGVLAREPLANGSGRRSSAAMAVSTISQARPAPGAQARPAAWPGTRATAPARVPPASLRRHQHHLLDPHLSEPRRHASTRPPRPGAA
jgi:aryl-alcohol dehydrogenase-like predicted oxidoreductase